MPKVPRFGGIQWIRKIKSQPYITLIENENILSDREQVADVLNAYFIEAVKNFEIENVSDEVKPNPQSVSISEVIENIIKKY